MESATDTATPPAAAEASAPAAPAAPPKELGVSEPGFVPPEPHIAESSAQSYVDRLHTLVDTAERELPSQSAWVTREMRAILKHLGATKSE